MYKVLILLSFLCLSIFADQNNTISEKQKMQDEVLLHTIVMSQFLQTIDENDSIAEAVMDTYTNCYIEKMKDLDLNNLNTITERKTERFINNVNSVDYNCIDSVYNKYALINQLEKTYKKEILEVIKKYVAYPKAAQRMRMTGTVHVGFILTKNGSFHALRINKSSNFDWLDKAALESVKKAIPFFPKPPRTLSLGIPIQYELLDSNDNKVTKKNTQKTRRKT